MCYLYVKIPSDDFSPSMPLRMDTENMILLRLPLSFGELPLATIELHCYIDISWSTCSSLQLIMSVSYRRRFPISSFNKEFVKVDIGVSGLTVN